jgi:hypothetical protein
LNRRDSESEHGAAGDDFHPGAAQPPGQDEVESTHVRPSGPSPDSTPQQVPASDEINPVRGVVVFYSETHESDVTEPDPRLGRVYPLREGEILFVGRYPAPAEVLLRNGETAPPTYSHLFPHGGLYGYISRQHLTVEMDPLVGTILTDYSRHGVYLEKAGTWHRRKDPTGPPESHRVTGEETVVLMDDLGEPTQRDLVDRRSHYRLHIFHSKQLTNRDRMTEAQP